LIFNIFHYINIFVNENDSIYNEGEQISNLTLNANLNIVNNNNMTVSRILPHINKNLSNAQKDGKSNNLQIKEDIKEK
jgi:hypothetical protein